MSNTSAGAKTFPKGLKHRYVEGAGVDNSRSLLAKLYVLHGREERKRCRDCAAFIRSRQVYTAGRCDVACPRGHFSWRGDWVACGLIKVAEEADAEFRQLKPSGRRPVVRIDADSGLVIKEPRRVRRKKNE